MSPAARVMEVIAPVVELPNAGVVTVLAEAAVLVEVIATTNNRFEPAGILNAVVLPVGYELLPYASAHVEADTGAA